MRRQLFVAGCAIALALLAYTRIAGAEGAADASARVPATPYTSAFKDYRSQLIEKPGSWRDANDMVRKLDGHAGHLKALQEEEARIKATQPAKPIDAPKPAEPVTSAPSAPKPHLHKH